MKRHHPHADERVARPLPGPLVGLGADSLFGAPSEIRLEAPSAPGSATSAEAASLVSVDGECLRCLQWYARQAAPRTRYELAAAVYPVGPGRDVMGIGPACGRTNDLVALGYLEEIGRQGRRATLVVTERGRAWLAKRRAA